MAAGATLTIAARVFGGAGDLPDQNTGTRKCGASTDGAEGVKQEGNEVVLSSWCCDLEMRVDALAKCAALGLSKAKPHHCQSNGCDEDVVLGRAFEQDPHEDDQSNKAHACIPLFADQGGEVIQGLAHKGFHSLGPFAEVHVDTRDGGCTPSRNQFIQFDGAFKSATADTLTQPGIKAILCAKHGSDMLDHLAIGGQAAGSVDLFGIKMRAPLGNDVEFNHGDGGDRRCSHVFLRSHGCVRSGFRPRTDGWDGCSQASVPHQSACRDFLPCCAANSPLSAVADGGLYSGHGVMSFPHGAAYRGAVLARLSGPRSLLLALRSVIAARIYDPFAGSLPLQGGIA